MDQHADPAVRSGGGTLRPAPIEGMNSLRVDADGTDSFLHWVLRAATQDATIGLAANPDLVVRRYGFYVSFEAAAAIEPDRTNWHPRDMETLGLRRSLHALPKCPHVPRHDSSHLRLGALYVAEGSALGGRDLARGLDRLLGKDATEGRWSLIGRGPDTGEAWRGYLAQLSAASSRLFARVEIITRAVETFAAFEHWINRRSILAHG